MLIDDTLHLRPTLRRAWESPFTARSVFARENAEAIFKAVELGYLTLRRGEGHWSNVLRITPAGLAYLDPLRYALTPADITTEPHVGE